MSQDVIWPYGNTRISMGLPCGHPSNEKTTQGVRTLLACCSKHLKKTSFMQRHD